MDGIFVDYTWATIQTGVSEFIGNPVIVAGVTFALALRFGPRVVGAFMNAIRSR